MPDPRRPLSVDALRALSAEGQKTIGALQPLFSRLRPLGIDRIHIDPAEARARGLNPATSAAWAPIHRPTAASHLQELIRQMEAGPGNARRIVLGGLQPGEAIFDLNDNVLQFQQPFDTPEQRRLTAQSYQGGDFRFAMPRRPSEPARTGRWNMGDPARVPESVAAHEFGHAADNTLSKWLVGHFKEPWAPSYWQRLADFKGQLVEFAPTISNYAEQGIYDLAQGVAEHRGESFDPDDFDEVMYDPKTRTVTLNPRQGRRAKPFRMGVVDAAREPWAETWVYKSGLRPEQIKVVSEYADEMTDLMETAKSHGLKRPFSMNKAFGIAGIAVPMGLALLGAHRAAKGAELGGMVGPIGMAVGGLAGGVADLTAALVG